MSRLEDFMVENKECWENFNRFISGKITFALRKTERWLGAVFLVI